MDSSCCQRGLGLQMTAVHQQQVRQRARSARPRPDTAASAAAAPPVRRRRSSALVQRLDLEAAVVPLQRLAVRKDHHGGHHVLPRRVGDIVGSPSAGAARGRSANCWSCSSVLLTRSGVRGDALHLLTGIAPGHPQQLCPLAPLGDPQQSPGGLPGPSAGRRGSRMSSTGSGSRISDGSAPRSR